MSLWCIRTDILRAEDSEYTEVRPVSKSMTFERVIKDGRKYYQNRLCYTIYDDTDDSVSIKTQNDLIVLKDSINADRGNIIICNDRVEIAGYANVTTDVDRIIVYNKDIQKQVDDAVHVLYNEPIKLDDSIQYIGRPSGVKIFLNAEVCEHPLHTATIIARNTLGDWVALDINGTKHIISGRLMSFANYGSDRLDSTSIGRNLEGGKVIRQCFYNCSDRLSENKREIQVSDNPAYYNYYDTVKNLRSITDTPYEIDEFGYIYTRDGDRLDMLISNIEAVSAAQSARLKSIKMGPGIRRIRNFGFVEQKRLEAATLGQDLIDIGESAFEGCINLRSVDFSKCKKLKYIAGNAFRDILLNSDIDLSNCDSLVEIGNGAFEESTDNINNIAGRINVILPENIRRIGVWAFHSLEIEVFDMSKCKEVVDIGEHAFNNTLVNKFILPKKMSTDALLDFLRTGLFTRELIINDAILDIPNTKSIFSNVTFEKIVVSEKNYNAASGLLKILDMKNKKDIIEIR